MDSTKKNVQSGGQVIGHHGNNDSDVERDKDAWKEKVDDAVRAERPWAERSKRAVEDRVTQADIDAVFNSLNAGKTNVGNVERAVSVVLGGLILLAVRRKLLLYGGVLAAAAYLLYRGIGGRCRLYEELGFDTSDLDFSDLDLSRLNVDQIDLSEIMQKKGDPSAASAQDMSSAQSVAREQLRDEVDEANYESFPASDPPSTW